MKEIVQYIGKLKDNKVQEALKENQTHDSFDQMDDAQIWELFRSGDEAAFIQIYKCYFHSLIRFGSQYFDKTDDVEDFVQDLFIDLRLKRKKLVPIKSSIKVFLFISLKNKIIDYKRKIKTRNRNMEKYHDDFEVVPPLEDDLIKTQEYTERITRLNQAISGLTVRQREAIYYLYHENLSYGDIAKLMNLDNIKSARNIVYKAFILLKKML